MSQTLTIPILQNIQGEATNMINEWLTRIYDSIKKQNDNDEDATDRDKKRDSLLMTFFRMFNKQDTYSKIKGRLYKFYERTFIKGKWFKNAGKWLKTFAENQSGWLVKLLMFLSALAFLDPSGKFFSSIINTIINIGLNVINVLIRTLPTIISTIFNLLPKLAATISKAVARIFSSLGTMFDDVAKKNPDSVIGKLYSFLSWLSRDLLSPVLGSVTQYLDKIIIAWGALILGIKMGSFVMNAFTRAQQIWAITTKAGTVLLNLFTFGLKIMGGVLAIITSPIGLVVVIIGALVALFVLLYKKVKPFRDAINGLWKILKTVFSWIWGKIKKIITPIKSFLLMVGKVFSKYIIRPIKAFFNAIKTVIGKIKSGFAWFKNLSFDKIWESLKSWFSSISLKMAKTMGKIVGKVAGFLQRLWLGLKLGFTNIIDYLKALPTYVKGIFDSDGMTMYQAKTAEQFERATGLESDILREYATGDMSRKRALEKMRADGLKGTDTQLSQLLNANLKQMNALLGKRNSTDKISEKKYNEALEKLGKRLDKLALGSSNKAAGLPYIRTYEKMKSATSKQK